MLGGVLRPDSFHLSASVVAEGASGRGQNDFGYLFDFSPIEALKNRIVLTVDGKYSNIEFAGCGRDELPRHDEYLLACESDLLAGCDCGQGRFETGCSDYGHDYCIDIREGCNFFQAVHSSPQCD